MTAHAAVCMLELVAPLCDPAAATVRPPRRWLEAVYPYVAGTTGRRDVPTGRNPVAMLARFFGAVRDVFVAGSMRSAPLLVVVPWLRERFVRRAAEPMVARKLRRSVLVTTKTAATPLHAKELPRVLVCSDVVIGKGSTMCGPSSPTFAHESQRSEAQPATRRVRPLGRRRAATPAASCR